MNMLATLNQGIVPQAETAANVLAAQAKAQVEARYMMLCIALEIGMLCAKTF